MCHPSLSPLLPSSSLSPHSPGAANTEHFRSTWAATWVQVVSAWLCFAVYLWTLLAPLVLGRCRDFDYD